MEGFFLEKLNAAIGLVPVDLNDGANTGIRIDMRNAKRAVFLVAMGDSTAAVTNFSLKQHDAASSGNTSALSVANPYYKKVGIAPAAFTKVVPVSATDNFVPTDFAGDPGLIAFEVLAEDLNRADGFGWVSLSLIDATAAKLGACIVLVEPMFKPGYAQLL